jgi:CheY-like chemotaxis protein
MTESVRIFVVEDNPADVFLVRQALQQEQLNFQLFLAEDGDAALSLLEQVGKGVPAPDVLLLDLNLPGVDGPELFQRVRQHPLCKDVPIVVFTSSDSPKDRAWTSDFQISHYFRKPSDYDEFMKLGGIIRSLIR